MKVSLKRADRHARTCIEVAKKLDLKASETISIHDALLHGIEGKPSPTLLERLMFLSRENTNAVQMALCLSETGYVIRQQIGEANMAHGVSPLLTRKEDLKLRESILTRMLSQLSETGEAAETAIAKANHARMNPPTRSVYGDLQDKISVTVHEHETLRIDIETLLRKIKNERETIDERVTMLNVTTQIEFGQKTVDILRQAGIFES